MAWCGAAFDDGPRLTWCVVGFLVGVVVVGVGYRLECGMLVMGLGWRWCEYLSGGRTVGVVVVVRVVMRS